MSLESRRERAEQFLADTAAAFLLDMNKLVLRHNRALTAVRALWISRRKWQTVAADLQAKVAELEEDYAHLLNGGAQ